MSWTIRELTTKMRTAGWQRVSGPGRCYERNGRKVYLDKFAAWGGERPCTLHSYLRRLERLPTGDEDGRK